MVRKGVRKERGCGNCGNGGIKRVCKRGDEDMGKWCEMCRGWVVGVLVEKAENAAKRARRGRVMQSRHRCSRLSLVTSTTTTSTTTNTTTTISIALVVTQLLRTIWFE
ncbi:hypothetical protein M0802_012959 [Mischocyttarus mexicanus]|nr:hypothetical protein M0802_012962 [Mischocyttarus mexicanus]KAI4484913.1 hypothetical protein M0802_012959 [Mischocyttarus mexicanus]